MLMHSADDAHSDATAAAAAEQALSWRTRKPCCRKETARRRDAAAVLFSLKYADNIHCKFKSSQASKARLQSYKVQTCRRKRTEF